MSLMKKNSKKKRIWSSREEAFLCELWATKIDMLRGARKNSHILEEMRLELEVMGGILVSKNEIQTKMHNLTTRYRKEKDKVGVSGGSPSSWEMYPKLHASLGSFKMNNLKDVVEESITDNTNTQETFGYSEYEVLLNDSQTSSFEEMPEAFQVVENCKELPSTSHSCVDSLSTPCNTKIKNRDDMLKKIFNNIELLEEREEKDRLESIKWEEKIYSLELEKKKILEKISNDNEEVKNEILKFLRRANDSK